MESVHKMNNAVIEMQYRNFVDPGFWHPDEENMYRDVDYVMIDGKPVDALTTLKELGLEVSNNENDFSDPGARNVSSNNNNRRIRRTTRVRTVKRKGSSQKKKKTPNNRFGFKKAFGALTRSLKKITGRSRRRRN
jgi:hypothetical protein